MSLADACDHCASQLVYCHISKLKQICHLHLEGVGLVFQFYVLALACIVVGDYGFSGFT